MPPEYYDYGFGAGFPIAPGDNQTNTSVNPDTKGKTKGNFDPSKWGSAIKDTLAGISYLKGNAEGPQTVNYVTPAPEKEKEKDNTLTIVLIVILILGIGVFAFSRLASKK